MIFKQWDIAVIPFPFVDAPKSKLRPVVILSNEKFTAKNAHCIAAMITSAAHTRWMGDTTISDLESAGLKKESLIRLKLFTLDMRLAVKVIGHLSEKDQESFQKNFSASVSIKSD